MSVVVSRFLFCFLSFARSLPSGPCSVRSGRPGRFFMHGIYTLRYACEKRDGRTVCLRMPGVGCRGPSGKGRSRSAAAETRVLFLRVFPCPYRLPVRVGCVLPACVPVASGTAVVAVTVRRERCRGGDFIMRDERTGHAEPSFASDLCGGLEGIRGVCVFPTRSAGDASPFRSETKENRSGKRSGLRTTILPGISVGNYSVMTEVSSAGAAA